VHGFLFSWRSMPLLGMTAYIFDPGIPLFARGLSSFHAWLPFVLVFLMTRLGYDRRAPALTLFSPSPSCSLSAGGHRA